MKSHFKYRAKRILGIIHFDHIDVKSKQPASTIERWKKQYDESPSDMQTKTREHYQDLCDKFFKMEEFKNGDKDTAGYGWCCDVLDLCGGMSGWMIFLIILIVLLVIAGAAAAFWFFYYKRKMGGRDEEKEIESTANTGHDISVETY